MANFDGVAKKGKTDGKQLGVSGATVPQFTGKGGSGGKTNADMLKYGRNLAKVAAQKRGSGRGR